MVRTSEQQSDGGGEATATPTTATTPPIDGDGRPAFIAACPVRSALWAYFRGSLEAGGKWRPEFGGQFAVFVDALAAYCNACEQLAGADPIITNPRKGSVYRNPLVDLKAQYAATIRQYGDAFGLSPASYDRLTGGAAGGDLRELFDLLKGPTV